MSIGIVQRMMDWITKQEMELEYPPVAEGAICDAERAIGHPIPIILRECYLKIGNGGFGPGYGIIGLREGYTSDFGDLVETYNQLKNDYAMEGKKWPEEMLPYCEWGCNIFTCVDATGEGQVYTFADFLLSPVHCTLETFFQLWMSGRSIWEFNKSDANDESISFVNPFTGDRESIRRRGRSE